MKKQTLKEMLKNIVEYDGVWHKGDKDGNCESFTMVDLKELLTKQKEEIIEKVEQIMGDTLSADTPIYHREVDKMYHKLEKL